VKCGARVALGVIGGYFLGRTKKMKLAMMLGGMAAGRRAGGPGELLRTGTKLLNSSPELARLTDEVRGRLLEAGKGAALAVAARQVESLTDRVGKRVESLSDVGVPSRKKAAEPEDEYEEEDAERADVDDEGPQAEDEDEEEALPPRRARPRARTGSKATSTRGKTAGATATLKRTAGSASGATRAAGKAAAGRKSGRTPRTPRSDGDG
jgi:hypothetical protein